MKDPAFKAQAPLGTNGGVRLDGIELPGGKPLMDPVAGKWFGPLREHMAPLNHNYEFALKRDWDGISQLEAMDREGVDQAGVHTDPATFTALSYLRRRGAALPAALVSAVSSFGQYIGAGRWR